MSEYPYFERIRSVRNPLNAKDIQTLKMKEAEKLVKKEVDRIMSDLSKHLSRTINIELKF